MKLAWGFVGCVLVACTEAPLSGTELAVTTEQLATVASLSYTPDGQSFAADVSLPAGLANAAAHSAHTKWLSLRLIYQVGGVTTISAGTFDLADLPSVAVKELAPGRVAVRAQLPAVRGHADQGWMTADTLILPSLRQPIITHEPPPVPVHVTLRVPCDLTLEPEEQERLATDGLTVVLLYDTPGLASPVLHLKQTAPPEVSDGVTTLSFDTAVDVALVAGGVLPVASPPAREGTIFTYDAPAACRALDREGVTSHRAPLVVKFTPRTTEVVEGQPVSLDAEIGNDLPEVGLIRPQDPVRTMPGPP